LAIASIHSYEPPFWALPTTILSESAAAASVGLINSIGSLGGFVGPFVMGHLVTQTGSLASGLAWLLTKSPARWNSYFVYTNPAPSFRHRSDVKGNRPRQQLACEPARRCQVA
jgi:nitrate/nitrite transporter NarK